MVGAIVKERYWMPWANAGASCGADVDADGICDSEDPCIGGVLDECGVCDGPGAVFECGCADIPKGDCDCDGNQLDALGNAGEIALPTSMATGFAMCPVAPIPRPAIMTLWPTQMMAVVNSRPITTTVQGIVSMTAMAMAFAMSWKSADAPIQQACNYEEASEDDGSCAYSPPRDRWKRRGG